jgi:hypothetical protein
MFFKYYATLATAATGVFAAPVQDYSNSPSATRFTLRLHPGAGAMGMKPLQLRDNKVVFGLEKSNSSVSPLEVDVKDKQLAVVSNGPSGGEITVAANGQLLVSQPSSTSSNSTAGWLIQGGGSFVSEVYYKGSQEFYSCTSEDGAVVGGQEVYLLGSANYTCEEPFKFTLGATGVQQQK